RVECITVRAFDRRAQCAGEGVRLPCRWFRSRRCTAVVAAGMAWEATPAALTQISAWPWPCRCNDGMAFSPNRSAAAPPVAAPVDELYLRALPMPAQGTQRE